MKRPSIFDDPPEHRWKSMLAYQRALDSGRRQIAQREREKLMSKETYTEAEVRALLERQRERAASSMRVFLLGASNDPQLAHIICKMLMEHSLVIDEEPDR